MSRRITPNSRPLMIATKAIGDGKEHICSNLDYYVSRQASTCDSFEENGGILVYQATKPREGLSKCKKCSEVRGFVTDQKKNFCR